MSLELSTEAFYLADLVVEIRSEGQPASTVQFEMYLILAASAEEAYDKALRIGGTKAKRYLRNDGQLMEFIFRGLNDLVMVSEELKDGSRILHRTQMDVTEDEIQSVITDKDLLRAVQAETSHGGRTVQ